MNVKIGDVIRVEDSLSSVGFSTVKVIHVISNGFVVVLDDMNVPYRAVFNDDLNEWFFVCETP